MPAKTTKPKPAAATAGFEPIRIAKTQADASDPGVPLFYLGDDEYRVPTKVPRSLVLEFLRIARTDGEMSAAQRALERLLGPEAYRALEQSDEVQNEHLEQILNAVIVHISGAAEPGKARA